MSESILNFEGRTLQSSRPGALQRWARRALHARLREMKSGELVLVDGGEAIRFGEPGGEPSAHVYVRDPDFYLALVARGAMGGAESYMDGQWVSDDLTAVIRILVRNREVWQSLDHGVARLAKLGLRSWHERRANTRAGSRRNIADHYDLGNEFFELFLDPTLTYSAGIFESPQATMEEASIAKYERICRKLRIGPDDHVLEIGTGWGGFAIHAAEQTGCRVTTTTISREQHALAKQRVAARGLSDRVELRLEDYRDLRGRYDKLVSIEMIEAVGYEHLQEYFRVCSERLEDDGEMLIQVITSRDQDLAYSLRNVDFIKRYIFPGGQLPSIGAMASALVEPCDLRITHLEDITPHYAETLRRWRLRMFEELDAMRELGLSERFLRMWEFYFCYCEGGFREREIGTAQILLEKGGCRRDPLLGHIPAR